MAVPTPGRGRRGAGVSARSRLRRAESLRSAGGERGGGCPGGAPPPGPGLGRAERGASPQPRSRRGCRGSERESGGGGGERGCSAQEEPARGLRGRGAASMGRRGGGCLSPAPPRLLLLLLGALLHARGKRLPRRPVPSGGAPVPAGSRSPARARPPGSAAPGPPPEGVPRRGSPEPQAAAAPLGSRAAGSGFVPVGRARRLPPSLPCPACRDSRRSAAGMQPRAP